MKKSLNACILETLWARSKIFYKDLYWNVKIMRYVFCASWKCPTSPTSLPPQKLKKRHNFYNICPIWLKFCTVLLLKHTHVNWSLQQDWTNFSQPTLPTKIGAYRDFSEKFEISSFFSKTWSEWFLELWFRKTFTILGVCWPLQPYFCPFSTIIHCFSA